MEKTVLEDWKLILLLIASSAGILLSYFDLLSAEYIPSFLLALMCIFVLFQMSENKKIKEDLKELKDLRGLATSAKVVNQKEFYSRLVYAITNARRTVDLTHHESRIPEKSGIKEKITHFRQMRKKIKEGKVTFRRIVTITNSEKLAWVKKQLQLYATCPNFNLRYSDVEINRGHVPALSMQIVDGKELFIIDIERGHHTISEPVKDLWIREPVVAENFGRYYEKYWKAATPLKEGEIVYWDTLAKIEEKLKNAGQRG